LGGKRYKHHVREEAKNFKLTRVRKRKKGQKPKGTFLLKNREKPEKRGKGSTHARRPIPHGRTPRTKKANWG